jgi:hypothetical protein
MKLAIAAACLVASISLAGHVFAEGRATAVLEKPLASKTEVVAAHSVWECDQGTCVASETPGVPLGAGDCRELARHVGAIADFRDEAHTLQPVELQRCDAGFATPGAVTTAQR